MITERCPHCGNIVAGEFTPSATRRYLTGLAKTGGMKAVLAAVGSVVPVLGNIGGFLAGGAIDLIYGNDIKKFIDKVADEFDDNKVYVFNCPQCGQSWAHTSKGCVENLYDKFCAEMDETPEDFYEEYEDDDLISELQERVEMIEGIFDSAEEHDILSNVFKNKGLVGIGMGKLATEITDYILHEKLNEFEDDIEDDLVDIKEDINDAINEFIEYIGDNCKGTVNSPIPYSIANRSKPFSMEVYGAYSTINSDRVFLVGVVLTGVIKKETIITLTDNEKVAVTDIVMFGESRSEAGTGDVCMLEIHTNSDFGSQSFLIGEYSNTNSIDSTIYKNNQGFPSVKSSQLTSDEEEYITEYKACLEEGGNISDRERRLLDRIRKSLGISEARARELEVSCMPIPLTEEEQEYADELKACLEDGTISDRERRLLNKVRLSLGISEERAREIEELLK